MNPMAPIAESALLGLIQGITEWLPVSSSGHLVLAQEWLNINGSVLLDTLLHIATLIAVIVVFWTDISKMFAAILHWDRESEHFRLFWYVMLATIPIVIVGFALQTYVEEAFSSTRVVGGGLLITGLLLWLSKYAKEKTSLNPKNAFLVGLAQIIALLPGISRSGTTISAGMFAGLSRDEAARFSFLMFIPAITGAAVLQSLTADWSVIDGGAAMTGMLVAFGVSVVALRWLLGVIREGKMHYFAFYCWTLGLIALII